MGCTSSSPAAAVETTKKGGADNGDKKPAAAAAAKHPPATTTTAHSSTMSATATPQSSVVGMTENYCAEPNPSTSDTVQLVGPPDLWVRYVCASRRGRDPDLLDKPNQDAYSVLHQKNSSMSFVGVYDGHGPHGHHCAQFVQRQLTPLVLQHLQDVFEDPAIMSVDQLHRSLHLAHVACNQRLHAAREIDDSLSGTTAVSLLLQPHRVTIANVGDSRAVLGTTTTNGDGNASTWQAVPLSQDQTPHRSDEADRCRRSGARILSFGQLDARLKDHDDDSIEDPPRVWAPAPAHYPGTAFTRSLGDAVAEGLGVHAEPECLTLSLNQQDDQEKQATTRVLILASDGVWDVLSNQQVVDMCYQHRHEPDPMRAAQAILQASHDEWLLNDDVTSEHDASYDDMTVAVLYLSRQRPSEKETTGDANKAAPQPTQPQPSHEPRKKRVRQKTLRNFDEMEHDLQEHQPPPAASYSSE